MRPATRGSFVLVKTSNPSSGELQNLQFEGGETLYAAMGRLCEQWGEELPGRYGYSGVGAVVGATYPDQLLELRHSLSRTFFLVPGYGAQGGGARDVLPGFDARGLGAIINASRPSSVLGRRQAPRKKTMPWRQRRRFCRMRDELVAGLGGRIGA